MSKTLRLGVTVAAAMGLLAVPVAVVAAPTPITQTGLVRIAGIDRYSTAVEVSKNSFAAPNATVFIASGENYPDALSGGPAAAKLFAPILLVRKDVLPPAVSAELRRLKPSRVYVLGGTGVVSSQVSAKVAAAAGAKVTRVAGVDRYATAVAIAKLVGASPTVYLASGKGSPTPWLVVRRPPSSHRRSC